MRKSKQKGGSKARLEDKLVEVREDQEAIRLAQQLNDLLATMDDERNMNLIARIVHIARRRRVYNALDEVLSRRYQLPVHEIAAALDDNSPT